MTHKLKTETFSQMIEHFGGAIFLSLISLFSFVTFHLKSGGMGGKTFFNCVLYLNPRVPCSLAIRVCFAPYFA